MDESEETPKAGSELERNVVSFSTVINRLPLNILNQRFAGRLALMELERIKKATLSIGGALSVTDGEEVAALDALEAKPKEETVKLMGTRMKVQWALFHRSAVAAFNHLLVREAAEEGSVGKLFLIAASGAPLLEGAGLSLIKKHFALLETGAGEVKGFHDELAAVVSLLHERIGAAESEEGGGEPVP